MALNKENVKRAWYILNAVNPNASNSFIQEYDRENPLQEDTIIGIDRKADDGWENIFINVRDITEEQIALFRQRKDEVTNSYFIAKQSNRSITRIGFF